ncbi:isochorismatase domain-containing protein 2A precursor [Metarhizium album ARSEF 1941]|uniref:Isochorismatase domain-containing protein 2A n=1 Tax=Metarhizium album (strain ARSEF 1941) TaxID=1081103 RepID=A0A0B2WZP8_METAS|nr:isochorismatase domain-containing protein 2A precursor [Metarhizium album ARSEF 1941]KHN99533.1 isochorismatase domain-containing protein 2A precursor [Metarhizium album ARSEF 1941]
MNPLHPTPRILASSSSSSSPAARLLLLHPRFLPHPRHFIAPPRRAPTATPDFTPTSSSSSCNPRAHLSRQLRNMAGSTAPTELRFKNPAILVATTTKLLTFANAVNIPVHATTQTAAKLGPTVPAVAALLPSTPHDKTMFSMLIPPLAAALPPRSRVALVGIESHICITQTALDLRDAGHLPYVIADAVSSCNKTEVIIALDRLRAEHGVTVTSSESWMYECMGDASNPAFKTLIGVVKAAVADTKRVLESLPPTSKF